MVILRIADRLSIPVHLSDCLESFILNIRTARQETNTPSNEGGDSVEASRKHGQADGDEFFRVEFGFFVLDDVGLDTRLMGSLLHAVIQLSVEGTEVFVSTVSHFFGFLGIRIEGIQAQERHVVLKVARGTSELADFFLDVRDLIEHILLLRSHSYAPIERQGETQTESLDHRHGVHGVSPTVSILE